MLKPQIRTKGVELHNILIVDDSCSGTLASCVETARKLGELQGECRFWTINYLNVFPIAMGIWTRELSNFG